MNYDKVRQRGKHVIQILPSVAKILASTQKGRGCHNLNVKLVKQNPSSACDLVQMMLSSAYRG